MAAQRFASYAEFWPYYVAMHSKPLTRRLHFTGTTLGALIAAFGVLTGRRKLLAAWPIVGYGFAWPSHWFVEGNNPASFGHPVWSLRGDFAMIGHLLRGRDAELTVIAQNWLAANAPDRASAGRLKSVA
jgi:hypothetical protein